MITLTQKNVILTGGKEALLHFAAIQAAPLYGTIEERVYFYSASDPDGKETL